MGLAQILYIVQGDWSGDIWRENQPMKWHMYNDV